MLTDLGDHSLAGSRHRQAGPTAADILWWARHVYCSAIPVFQASDPSKYRPTAGGGETRTAVAVKESNYAEFPPRSRP